MERTAVLAAMCRQVDMRYAVACEHALHVAAADAYDYSEQAFGAMSKLAANAAWIQRHVPATELPGRTWRELCTGLPVITHEQDADERARAFRCMLAQTVEQVRASTRDRSQSLVCGKCRSTDISVALRQTRSADEGMSGIATCRGCGARWKLN